MADRSSLQASAGGAGAAGAALRIVSGAMFICHGTNKLLGWPPPAHEVPLWSQLWIGGLIEIVCGALIAVGLFTRLAAFVASGTMAVAYFQFQWKVHQAGAMSDWNFLPLVNKGEPAVLYCFIFLVFAAAGAGPYSLDARRRRM
jgi:putative oxidoreductase